MNSIFKRDLRAQAPPRTHSEVVETFAACVNKWSQPMAAGGDRTSKPMTLMGLHCVSGPARSPCLWMLQKGQTARRPFAKAAEFMPSVGSILRRMRLRHSKYFEALDGEPRYLCMATCKPQEIEPGTARRMVKQLKIREVAKLQELLLKDSVLVPADEANAMAPLRLHNKNFEQLWLQRCLQWVPPSTDRVHCSCWYFQWHSHCPHSYAAEIWWGYRSDIAAPLPNAAEAARLQGDDERSDDEGIQRRKHRRR